MAETTEETPHEKFLKPVVTLLKSIGLLVDVGTLMIRMLFNTVMHETPQGKMEVVERE